MRAAAVLVTLIPLSLLGCLGEHKDSHEPWYPHVPTAWRVTPAGYTRDAGPFGSVEGGFISEEDLDAAVDAGYDRFRTLFPEYAAAVGNYPIGLNDDYVLWSTEDQNWASGLQITGDPVIHVCIWTRGTSSVDPGAEFIKRAPGKYWGVNYDEWRFTAMPLTPAIAHELLHTVIGDPQHHSPLWLRLN